MKIITVNSEADFSLIADSALTLPGRPTFLPDMAEAASWGGELLLAVRISRLGKSIAPKFAPRYFDAVSLVFRLLPLDAEGRRLDSLGNLMDFALAIGHWAPLPTAGEPLTIATDGATATIDDPTAAAASAVTAVSRIATLKMGDMLLLPIDAVGRRSVAAGTRVEATLGTERVLDFTIK